MFTGLFVIVLFLDAKTYADQKNDPGTVGFYIESQTFRAKSTKIEKIIEVLDIKPEMTILDIGTGTGQIAYKFAEKLDGTGKVFATDTYEDLIRYVNDEVNRKGLSNLYPIKVKKLGIDDFYKSQKYDLIFLSHLYFTMRDRENYFKEMRSQLNKGGRLVIISVRDFPGFTLNDFSDFDGLINQFLKESSNSPFYINDKRSTVRDLMLHDLELEHKEKLKKAIVDRFNKMQFDSHFWTNFLNDDFKFNEEVKFTPEEKIFADMLLIRLEGYKGEFKKIFKEMLNKLLIVQKFRKYLYGGKGIDPYKAQSRALAELLAKMELENAGYKFVQEYNFIPFELFLVFTAGEDSHK